MKIELSDDLKSPNGAYIIREGGILTADVLKPIGEILRKRLVAAELRRTPIVVTLKTANSNSI